VQVSEAATADPPTMAATGQCTADPLTMAATGQCTAGPLTMEPIREDVNSAVTESSQDGNDETMN
jgi:hypothetical protein